MEITRREAVVGGQRSPRGPGIACAKALCLERAMPGAGPPWLPPGVRCLGPCSVRDTHTDLRGGPGEQDCSELMGGRAGRLYPHRPAGVGRPADLWKRGPLAGAVCVDEAPTCPALILGLALKALARRTQRWRCKRRKAALN